MNTLLRNFQRCFLVCTLLCLASTPTKAQKLQTQAPLQKGHKLYKQIKMYGSKSGATETKAKRVADNAEERANYEFQKLRNPQTGQIPADIRDLELAFSGTLPDGSFGQKMMSGLGAKGMNYSDWKSRGPFNVGGRTRALAIDYTNENVIIAAGVSGGLWRSDNSGQTWRKTTRSNQAPNITSVVQDPRPSHSYIWYAASGERYGNSASSRGAFYRGTGVYKSQDGGRTWELLNATRNETIGIWDSPYDLINKITVNPINGDVYIGTISGLSRSKDGGNSFAEVLSGGFDTKTEITISESGTLYATMDSDSSPITGFLRSTDDGDTWTNITPTAFVSDYGRTIVCVAPSDEDTVYFLTQNNSDTGTAALLYRYNAAAEGTEAWTNLSANLPFSIGGAVGNLNLQREYNMVLKVHPTDPNLMIVGGTNLYRSTTGFTTPAGQESWIAGYSPVNDVSQYTNQHPDQHELLFYPSNPNKVLSGNDGGVFVTEDIRANNSGVEPVLWTSLNNGYITTQPYHVAFDYEANTDDLVAGFQDNGTWYTNSTAADAVWEEDFGGDGAYSAIADNGRTRYVSSQNGNILRFNFDEEGAFESYASITPAGASGFAFITPFILDPNNDNIMYLPAGRRIWRNNNLDQIPLFSNADATVNWVGLTNSDVAPETTITALAVSTYPVANRLYYGSNQGQIFKINNANIDDQPAIDISKGKGLPEAGYVDDINVDAANSDRVIVTFSNYGIQSVFITEDAGETWTNISGNLEENQDGSGNGPSVRGTAFLGAEGRKGARLQKVFAATSTGLYATDYLDGENTVWRKENQTIGTAVTHEVVTRKDGFVAVAAHGSGLFSARFPITENPLPVSTLSVAYLLDDIAVGPNNEAIVVDITDLFVQSEGLPIAVSMTNSNPDLVTAIVDEDSISLSFAPDGLGTATIGFVATSGNEQVSEGFTVTIAKPSLYEQVNPAVSSVPSQLFPDYGGGLAQAADDFTIPEGYVWTIDRLVAFGAVNGEPAFTSAAVVIYTNNDGVPGEAIYSSTDITPISDVADSNLNLMLPEAVTLDSGSYWISIYANLPYGSGNQWFWFSQDNENGAGTVFKDTLDLFGTGAVDWTSIEIALGRDPLDQVFQIYGDIQEIGGATVIAEASTLEPLAIVENDLIAAVWPNPSSTNFTFRFDARETANKTASLDIYAVSGKRVHSVANLPLNTNYVWDTSKMPSGFYIAKIGGEVFDRTFKLVKIK